MDLFTAQGYEKTTVESIAERAGVARRTFFRHFRAKDDVIFASHSQVIRSVGEHLSALEDLPPLRAVCSGTRLVMRSYVADPELAVQRYELIRSVPALRMREIAWVSQYTRLFAGYLRERFTHDPLGERTADIAAAAVVAAHNHVLRQWLRAGGRFDPFDALDDAFTWVSARFESSAESTVVAVFRREDPIDDVVERISRSL